MTIRIVLDSTVTAAYVAGDLRGLAISELMLSVAEDDQLTGVPALCLAEAYRAAHDDATRTRLMGLATADSDHLVVLPLLAADLPAFLDLARTLPSDLAQAAAAAMKHDAYLATYNRPAYPAGVIDPDLILDL